MKQNTEHNKPDYNTLPGMIIDIAKNDKDMKGDESHVWFVLGTLWQEYGVDYNPSIDLLISLCKRSERFIRDAIKKLREKLLVTFGRAQHTPGDRIKEAIYAFSNGEICPKAAIYAEKETAECAERQYAPEKTAICAEKRQNVPKQTAECAEFKKEKKQKRKEPKEKNKKIKNISYAPAREGDDFWNCLKTDSYNGGVTFDGEKIHLMNGTRQEWLEKFGNDEARLDLALIEIAGSIQPNSGRPLAVQVNSQLARKAGQKLDQDKRYENARKENAKQRPNTKPHQQQFKPSPETKKQMMELAEAKALLGEI